MLRLFLNKSLMLSPFRGSGFFHGNDVHVDHNTSVVLLFSIARGENARERTLSCELCLFMPSFIIWFLRLAKGSNTDERSTSLVVIMSKIHYIVIKLVVLLKDVCGILA